mgnify:CR=1 FL=1
MLDFPITENQIRVLGDDKLHEVLELCQQEYSRRQKKYYDKLVYDTQQISSQNLSNKY